MPRWPLLLLLAAAVVCGGIGIALVLRSVPPAAASFGWTAYAPLSRTAYPGGSHLAATGPFSRVWTPRLGAALLALGAGTAGAVVAALVLTRREAAPGHPGQGA